MEGDDDEAREDVLESAQDDAAVLNLRRGDQGRLGTRDYMRAYLSLWGISGLASFSFANSCFMKRL